MIHKKPIARGPVSGSESTGSKFTIYKNRQRQSCPSAIIIAIQHLYTELQMLVLKMRMTE